MRTQGGNYESISYIDGMFEDKTDGNDEQTLTYIMDDTSRIAMIRTGDDFGDTTPTIKYNLEDHLDSSSILLEDDGTLINKEEYYPFGETSFGSYAKKRYRYSGKEKDQESGLYYYGARYYAAWTCRFISVDPHASSYPNISPYAYVANNPINAIDPDGRDIIPVHGTWSDVETWENLDGIKTASNNLFGDNNLKEAFLWSGANYAELRTEAASGLIDYVRTQMKSESFNGEITLVGHSHGGNVSIEALNMMADMKEFDNVQLNLLTINTLVRGDYQLSKKALGRVNHVNVYDSKDPVQSNAGNSFVVMPNLPRTPDFMDANTKGTGEFGSAGRTFKNARNIQVDNPQGVVDWNIWRGVYIPDFHNSHNRINDWIKKTK